MADFLHPHTTGGQKADDVAAGSGAADVVVSDTPGRVCKLVVTTTASAALELHDDESASATADIVWKSAADIAAGSIIDLQIPCSKGIVLKQANGSAAVTISYTEDDVSGAVADKSLPHSDGGQYRSTHAAGSSGAAAASAVPGRLCRVVVLSAGSAATDIYDNASAASGVKLFTIPANPTVGDIYNVQMPAVNGIYVAGASNTSQCCVTYTKQEALGL